MEKINFSFKIKKSNYHCEYHFDENLNFIYIQISRNHNNIVLFEVNGEMVNYSGTVANKIYADSKNTEDFIEKVFSFFFKYLEKYSISLLEENQLKHLENKKIIKQIEDQERA